MRHLVKYLTVTVVAAAAFALPAAVTTGPSSASGSPVRGTEGVLPIGLPHPVRIIRTGGFAGVYQVINIFTNGGWRYSDRRHGIYKSGHLNRWQIRALRRLLSDPALPGSLGYHPPPLGCADAFRYRVTLAPWHPVSTYTDCGNPPVPLAAVVDAVIDFTPL